MRKTHRRKPLNWFLLGLISLPIIAIGAYFWSTNTISTLENYRSPLHAYPPEPGERIGDPQTRRVVIVLFDALRYDTSTDDAIMPVFNELRQKGASAIMHSQPPSYSAPGWVTILTGAWPDINDSQLMNPPDNSSTRTLTQDDIFAAADRAGLSSAIAGYLWFEQLLSNSGVDVGFFTNGEDNAADQEVITNALTYLQADYQLVLIHIDQIDYAGHHEGGPLGDGWKSAASRSDNILGSILNHLDFQQDTLLLLSDHGQIDKGGHGGDDNICLTEPFVAIGKSIIPGRYPDIDMIDIASTVAVLLGTNIPASNQGNPLFGFLDLEPTYEDMVVQALAKQQLLLINTYAQSIDSSIGELDNYSVQETQQAMEQARLGKLARERIWRNLISIFLSFTPAYILFLRKDRKVIWLVISSLIYLLIFNFRYNIIDGNTYSLSWITDVTSFIVYIGITSGISLIAAWLVGIIGLRSFQKGAQDILSVTLGIIWLIFYIISLPFFLNFALNGLWVSWTLPDFTILYLAFFSSVQALFISIVGFLIISSSALFFRINNKRSKRGIPA